MIRISGIILALSWRVRLALAARLLKLAGRGRGLWPYLPLYLLLIDIERMIEKKILLKVISKKCE